MYFIFFKLSLIELPIAYCADSGSGNFTAEVSDNINAAVSNFVNETRQACNDNVQSMASSHANLLESQQQDRAALSVAQSALRGLEADSTTPANKIAEMKDTCKALENNIEFSSRAQKSLRHIVAHLSGYGR